MEIRWQRFSLVTCYLIDISKVNRQVNGGGSSVSKQASVKSSRACVVRLMFCQTKFTYTRDSRVSFLLSSACSVQASVNKNMCMRSGEYMNVML